MTSIPTLKLNKKPVTAKQIQASKSRIMGSFNFQNFIQSRLKILIAVCTSSFDQPSLKAVRDGGSLVTEVLGNLCFTLFSLEAKIIIKHILIGNVIVNVLPEANGISIEQGVSRIYFVRITILVDSNTVVI